MKTAIMQPYLFPYIGYFQLIRAADQFVLYDDVAYIKNGWINRNRYLLNGEPRFFTLSLNKASSFTPINGTYILDDEKYPTKQKVLKTLQMAYSKAPFYKAVIELVEEILLHPENNMAVYNENSIRKVCAYLAIQTRIYVSSQLQKDSALRSQEKVIDICKNLNTTLYINAQGGRALYDQKRFNEKGMELKFLRSCLDRIVYPQFADAFLPGLSIIDVLMFNPVEQVRLFLGEYCLEN